MLFGFNLTSKQCLKTKNRVYTLVAPYFFIKITILLTPATVFFIMFVKFKLEI